MMARYGWQQFHAGTRVWVRSTDESDGVALHSLTGPYIIQSVVTEETIDENGQPDEKASFRVSDGVHVPLTCSEEQLVRDSWSAMKDAGGEMFDAAEIKEEPAPDEETLAAAEAAPHEDVSIAGVG